jgi:hypothetical protein
MGRAHSVEKMFVKKPECRFCVRDFAMPGSLEKPVGMSVNLILNLSLLAPLACFTKQFYFRVHVVIPGK